MEPEIRLRWTSHQGTVLSMFDALLSTESLVDVTLACDGQYLRAHRVVLSACSPYFQELLSLEMNKNPIVFLKDVKYAELKALIQYMYRGEVNIPQNELTSLLSVAQALRIRGLADLESTAGSGPTNFSSDTLVLPTAPPIQMVQQTPVIEYVNVPLATSTPTPRPNLSIARSECDGQPRQTLTLPAPVLPKQTLTRITRSSSATTPSPPSKRSRVDNTNKSQTQSQETDPFAEIPVPLLPTYNNPFGGDNFGSDDGYMGMVEEPEAFALHDKQMKLEPGSAVLKPENIEIGISSGDIENSMSHSSWGVEEGEEDDWPEEQGQGDQVEGSADGNVVAGGSSGGQSQAKGANAGKGKKKGLGKPCRNPEDHPWHCGKCNRSYGNKYTLHRHIKFECGVPKKFKCRLCGHGFHRKENCKAHEKSSHRRFL